MVTCVIYNQMAFLFIFVMDMDKRVKIYPLPEDSRNTITLSIKELFDILCNTSFNNTFLKIATIN